MSSSTFPSALSAVTDDGGMSSPSPRSGGPSRRRSLTPEQKLAHLAGTEHQGGAYLRREALYSSLISEWRRLRNAGVLEGKAAGEAVGRPTAEQAEIARLHRQLAASQQRLATT